MRANDPAPHSGSPEPEITHHGGAQRGVSAFIEAAYGLLWMPAIDKRTPEGNAIWTARRALLEVMDRDGQARGITWAKQAVAARQTPEKTPECGGDDC
ncbi:hypothetical protein [Bradyrhizobium diazoefficiens]|uniref:Uncharacterized protein n=1 Tax=Bradyrhizobium diazoefficiens TaxID=1355477 RepID=A0A809YQ54_9BRAD|nr:hypothetical protein [Bradyrhizobium diazoefficiens]BCA04155.1 hypothetical protein H12S4_50590 [Bradyrhizobium diazoefficiens]BCA21512.1 hypothetical protein BDHH15_47270 [Bradyrhizobium diazoefficiens]BCE39681.1 hypothetical protein XF3B_47120 [Bradyrhizobium diazoefficiens]BCF53077.1 hypothetical protein XF17B_47150 [Bradyrhizobium diazoefficiens]